MKEDGMNGGGQIVAPRSSFIERIISAGVSAGFAVRLWDGSTLLPETSEPRRVTLTLRCPEAAAKLSAARNLLEFAELYLDGEYTIEGDLREAIDVGYRLALAELSTSGAAGGLSSAAGGERTVGSEPAADPHERKRQAPRAVDYHYDWPVEFWRLWLDEQLQYTCAYFTSPEHDLDRAQRDKLDYVCRKLRLKPGERLLDLGCGWGGLMVFAAQNYGVNAVGITLNRRQAEVARAHIEQAGVSHRCHVEVGDFYDFQSHDLFDKATGIGIIEHVGSARQAYYFEKVWQLLRPGGFFLNQGITSPRGTPSEGGAEFIARYIFPGYDLTLIHETLRFAEEAMFEVRDVESLREHYSMTLQHWLSRFESNEKQLARFVGERVYRAFRLYLAGVGFYFHLGQLNVYQSLLLKPTGRAGELPVTRASLYR
jgi:cyclopropane-fatty-acyl-phospholipid synthase